MRRFCVRRFASNPLALCQSIGALLPLSFLIGGNRRIDIEIVAPHQTQQSNGQQAMAECKGEIVDHFGRNSRMVSDGHERPSIAAIKRTRLTAR